MLNTKGMKIKSLLSLGTLVFSLTSCGGSGGDSAKLIIVDYSLVNEDNQLSQEIQSSLTLQENSQNFFEKYRGRWNVVNQEMSDEGASASFTFLSKAELQIEMLGDIPNFGRARVIMTPPYVIEKAPVIGNQLGLSKSILKTVVCEEFIDKRGDSLLCGRARIQRLELLNEAQDILQFRDLSDGEILILRR